MFTSNLISQTTWLKVKLKLVNFISKLIDVYLMAGVHLQPDQSNYLAEGQTQTCMAGVHQQPEQSNFLAEGQM